MALFEPATGGEAVNLKSGSPEYQAAILQNTQRSLKPLYQNALRNTRANIASRGLTDSGIALDSERNLQQGYLGQMADAATKAATGGADLAEENRRRLENRGWAVEDRDLALAQAREQMDRQEKMAGAQTWADLLGGAAMAGGTALGGPLAGWLAGTATKGAGSAMARAATPRPYGVSGVGDVSAGKLDPSLAAYLQ